MTDLEVARAAIATLTDKLNAGTARAETLATQRQKLGFLTHVGNDATARRQLSSANTEMAALAQEVEDLKAALVQAHANLDETRLAAGRVTAAGHRDRARTICDELEALGPELDRTMPHPEDGRPYAFNDPPNVCAAAKLTAALVNEHLRGLSLTQASFPPFWHGAAGKPDFERALLKTIAIGWPSLAVDVTPRRVQPTMPGQGGRYLPQFTKIFSGWAAVIRKNLAQHEQANREAA
jgi:hypothetical protein